MGSRVLAANHDYFRSPEHAERVRAWRTAHPGYWRHASGALQEHSLAQPTDSNEKIASLTPSPLQDLSRVQPLVLYGLIAHLTGAALQEDIALATRRFQSLAHDILNADTERDALERTRPFTAWR